MSTPTRIAILGATGRMGRAIIQSVAQNSDLVLAAALDRSGNPLLGLDAATQAGLPPAGVAVTDDLQAVAGRFDVLIDFSRPEATLAALPVCLAHGRGMVIGTTGFTPQQKAELASAARKIPICLSANYSIGVNVTLKLLELAAKTLGDGYDVEIVEAHHRHKIDAPSGTALRMGEAVAAGLGRDLKDCAVYERYGNTGARPAKTIGFATVRGGDVVGDHTVMFLGEGERVEIVHKATSRGNFSGGAVRAAAWLRNRPAGLYEMRDVLGL
ncbi:MAG: 4-hydroxy-tetrahydrodipicolinate reductase [Stenotrophobium sp.]